MEEKVLESKSTSELVDMINNGSDKAEAAEQAANESQADVNQEETSVDNDKSGIEKVSNPDVKEKEKLKITYKDKAGIEKTVDAPNYLYKKKEDGTFELKTVNELMTDMVATQDFISKSRNPNKEIEIENKKLKSEIESLKGRSMIPSEPANISRKTREELKLPSDKSLWTADEHESYDTLKDKYTMDSLRESITKELQHKEETIGVHSKNQKLLDGLQEMVPEFKTKSSLLDIEQSINETGQHPESEIYHNVIDFIDEFNKKEFTPAEYWTLKNIDSIKKGLSETLTKTKIESEKNIINKIKAGSQPVASKNSRSKNIGNDEIAEFLSKPGLSSADIIDKIAELSTT